MFTAVAIVAIACVSLSAAACDLPAESRALRYEVVDQDLRGVLAGMAAEMGLHADVSEKVRGEVRGRLQPAAPRDMLDRLASLYQFDWYFDGATLYVSANTELADRLVPLGRVDARDLLATLAQLCISDQRHTPRVASEGDIIMVSGPPRYQALVQQTVDAISQRQHEVAQATLVFRGSAASAP